MQRETQLGDSVLPVQGLTHRAAFVPVLSRACLCGSRWVSAGEQNVSREMLWDVPALEGSTLEPGSQALGKPRPHGGRSVSRPCGLGSPVTSPALGTIEAATGVTPYPQLLPIPAAIRPLHVQMQPLAFGPQTRLVQPHGHLPALAQPPSLWDKASVHLTARLCSQRLGHGPS